jgi:hypothetical protein
MRTPRRVLVTISAVVIVAAGTFFLSAAASGRSADHRQDELAAARAFTAGLRTPAQAAAAGWFDSGLPCFENPGTGSNNGGMGLHWLRKGPDGAVPDPAKPEALVFDPVTHQLVAVEYVILKDAWVGHVAPSLFGQDFTPATLPNGAVVYKLHAWLWKPNPNGMFADFNPDVSLCP